MRPFSGGTPDQYYAVTDLIEEVIWRATTEMYRARRRGGNQAEHVIEQDGL